MTRAVATIIHAVSPVSILFGAGAGAVAAAAGAAEAGTGAGATTAAGAGAVAGFSSAKRIAEKERHNILISTTNSNLFIFDLRVYFY
jgi:hypothetical protein